MHSNVPTLLLNQNCNIAPNIHAYNFPNFLYIPIIDYISLFMYSMNDVFFAQCAYLCFHFLLNKSVGCTFMC